MVFARNSPACFAVVSFRAMSSSINIVPKSKAASRELLSGKRGYDVCRLAVAISLAVQYQPSRWRLPLVCLSRPARRYSARNRHPGKAKTFSARPPKLSKVRLAWANLRFMSDLRRAPAGGLGTEEAAAGQRVFHGEPAIPQLGDACHPNRAGLSLASWPFGASDGFADGCFSCFSRSDNWDRQAVRFFPSKPRTPTVRRCAFCVEKLGRLGVGCLSLTGVVVPPRRSPRCLLVRRFSFVAFGEHRSVGFA